MYPTYQQLYAVPESLDAEVELWKLNEENRFTADLEELEKLIRPASQDGTGGTKLIIYNVLSLTHTIAPSNSSNPIRNLLPSEAINKIVNLAKSSGISQFFPMKFIALYFIL